MRIQHNIPAMSSYRNYTNNTSALAKNLEKLSSGYKINRAGDDAAGLAISEKMRAQISGLEQAQSNAKSGINLVQTAEGALTEVHDMLNRMVTLAEQSANGTYDNEVDRVQLQKEVDQLRSEINRIADSANFNGIKLLDGSMDAVGTETVNPATFGNLKGMALQDVETGADQKKIQFHKEGNGDTKTSFEVDLSQVATYITNWNAAKVGNTEADTEVTGFFDIWSNAAGGATTTSLTDGNAIAATGANSGIKYTVKTNSDGKVDGAALAEAIYKGMMEPTTDTGVHSIVSDKDESTIKFKIDSTDIEYKVEVDGDKLRFTMTDAGQAAARNAATATTPNKSIFRGNFKFAVSQDTDATNYKWTFDNVKFEAADTGKTQMPVEGSFATSNITVGETGVGTQYAVTCVDTNDIGLKAGKVKDGSGVQIGDQYYVWALSDETANGKYGDNVHIVDLRDLTDENGDLTAVQPTTTANEIGYNKTVGEAVTRLTKAAADNKMWNVQYVGKGNQLVFSERITNESDADLTDLKGLQSVLKTFDSINADITKNGGNGKALTLQIGDTAESFNQMKVNIGDMHAAAMGIGDIDISTQEGAAAAMDKISDAINYVSDVRGTLGATQNRLDHTISNLSVMQENIQDAESTIRDVDIAAEMMNYTKNSILVQSAQAMLAQANQMPQGVLQLLQ